MRSELKTAIFKALDVLPRSIADQLYHGMQRIKDRSSIERKLAVNLNTFELIRSLVDRHGRKLEGMHVVELGSGWLPVLPYLLRFQGKCASVSSFDLNRHYSKRSIASLNRVFCRQFCPPDFAPERLYGLPAGIDYFPHTDLSRHDFGSKKVDLMVSRFVLEHVTPGDLQAIHEAARHFLAPGGLVVHSVSPSDHRSYSDRRLSSWDFLRYSTQEWDNIQTRFDYHNRLRLPHYEEIFRQSGLEIVESSYVTPPPDSEQARRFSAVPLHDDFKTLEAWQLMANSLVFVLRKDGRDLALSKLSA